jgi:hypothetical protein
MDTKRQEHELITYPSLVGGLGCPLENGQFNCNILWCGSVKVAGRKTQASNNEIGFCAGIPIFPHSICCKAGNSKVLVP